jgi:hypothetical protein
MIWAAAYFFNSAFSEPSAGYFPQTNFIFPPGLNRRTPRNCRET